MQRVSHYNLANDNQTLHAFLNKGYLNDFKQVKSEIKGVDLNISSPFIVKNSENTLADMARLAIACFQGILIAQNDDMSFTLSLKHINEENSVFLQKSQEETVIADWRSWGKRMNLPLLVEAEDGSIQQPYQHLGALQISKPESHRRGNITIFKRRPRHFARKRLSSQAV